MLSVEDRSTSDPDSPFRIGLVYRCLGLGAFWVIFLWGFWDKGFFALGFNAFIFLLLFFLLVDSRLGRKCLYSWSEIHWHAPLFLVSASYNLALNKRAESRINLRELRMLSIDALPYVSSHRVEFLSASSGRAWYDVENWINRQDGVSEQKRSYENSLMSLLAKKPSSQVVAIHRTFNSGLDSID